MDCHGKNIGTKEVDPITDQLHAGCCESLQCLSLEMTY